MNKSTLVALSIVLVFGGFVAWALYERNHRAEKHNDEVHKESPAKDTQNTHASEPKKADPPPCEKTEEAKKPKPRARKKQKAKEKSVVKTLAPIPIAVVSKNPLPIAIVSKDSVSTTDVPNEP